MIETRTKQVLDFLTSDYEFHTSEEIAKAMELSSKSIQKEINILNNIINEKGAIVNSEAGKGYKFIIIDEEKFKAFLRNDWYKYAYYQQESGSKDLRIENILKILLFSNSYIKQQELADMFYVSVSQINKDIKEVRKLLKTYNISLISKPYYGMKIEGDEKSIRLAIRNEIGEDPEIFATDEDKLLFTKIQEIISENKTLENFLIPYANFKNLVVHIYISILRIRAGQFIELPTEVTNRVVEYEEFNLAHSIVDELNEKLEIKFPKDEILYLAMHMISKNTITDYEKVSAEIAELAQEMIDEIYDVSKYDFRSNIDLFFALSLHLGPLIERIRYGLPMKNPIIKDIKENQVAFMLATIASNVINRKYKTKITDDEIGYIALHIASAMDNNYQLKRDILVVCGSGNSSAQIMKSQIEKSYGDQINTLEITDYINLKDYNMDKFDFIISSIPIKIKTKTPIVYVDVIFKKKDFERIDDIFNVEGFEVLNKIFNNSIFIRDITFKNSDEVIDFLSEKVSEKTKIPKNEIKNQYYKREELAFTTFGSVAIPHIMEQVEVESFAIILIPEKPVEWNGDFVKVIYSLIIGKDNGDLALYYNKLGSYLNNDKLIDQSAKSKNINEFLNSFIGGGIYG